jgi:hypothetical protein
MGFVTVGGAVATSCWVGVDVAVVIGSVDVGVQAATPTIIKPITGNNEIPLH